MPITVLLTNDDGPPGRESPYVFGLYKHLRAIGWTVKVVLPSSQKSWIGGAYQIKELTTGHYYYPQDPDGRGELADEPRPLKEGEIDEWILLDGTPATCANIALHNLYSGQIDLVISGPNLGRNTSSAFALSSGTIGAALSASLTKQRAIAVSYGTMVHPTPKTFFDPAHALGVKIIQHLWNNWSQDTAGGLRQGEVDLYNVNIPLIEQLLSEEGLKIYWTTLWRNSYARLFKPISAPSTGDLAVTGSHGGPDAQPVTGSESKTVHSDKQLTFKWSPDMEGPRLLRPDHKDVPVGSDGWAILNGHVSVTALGAAFAEGKTKETSSSEGIEEEWLWKYKL